MKPWFYPPRLTGPLCVPENLPDAGKAQDFMKRFNQVLGEDEKLRIQLDTLISPTCSCKQAEICVVRHAHTHTHTHAVTTGSGARPNREFT